MVEPRLLTYLLSTASEKLKKRRDGTPDKPTTPGPDDDGSMEGRANVINDEEIQNLAIKQNELDRVMCLSANHSMNGTSHTVVIASIVHIYRSGKKPLQL